MILIELPIELLYKLILDISNNFISFIQTNSLFVSILNKNDKKLIKSNLSTYVVSRNDYWIEANYLLPNGYKHGTQLKIDMDDHTIFQTCTYKNNLKHGCSIRLYDSETLWIKEYFKKDKNIGLYQQYYTNGQLEFEYYFNENGQESGISRLWYEDGKLGSMETYKNGILNGKSKYYHINGQLKNKYYYENDRRQNQCIGMFNNGNIKYDGYWRNGKRIGLWKVYYITGQIAFEGEYDENGKQFGIWYFYWQSGTIMIIKYDIHNSNDDKYYYETNVVETDLNKVHYLIKQEVEKITYTGAGNKF